MRWTQNASWADAGGIRQVVPDVASVNPFDGEGRILSLHWFAQHNGARQWTIWTTSEGEFRAFHGSTPATPWDGLLDTDYNAITLTTVGGSWVGTQSAAWSGRMYFVNGYDQPMVFNGRYVDRAGFDARPGTVTARSLTRHDNNDLNWRTSRVIAGAEIRAIRGLGLGKLTTDEAAPPDPDIRIISAYRYICTFMNERGQESQSSVPSEVVEMETSDAGKLFAKVYIPTGGSNVVARRIYRTRDIYNADGEPLDLGFGVDFYFLREIQDNVCTVIEDGIPDSVLGSLFDEIDFGPWPTSAKFIASFKNTMFVVGDDGLLRYSAPLFPEVFPEDNVLDISNDGFGPPTGIHATKNALVFFKARGIYLIKGDPPDFTAQALTKDVGCIAPNTVKELPGLGVVFLSIRGVFLLVGALENTGTETKVVEISSNIRDIITRFNTSGAVNASGEVYHKDQEYWLSVPTLGDARNNLILVYHYNTGEWSQRPGFPAGCLVESADHRGYLFMGSNDGNDKPGVMVYSTGWPDKLDGDEVMPVYESSTIDFGSVYGSINPKYVFIYGVAEGNNELTLSCTVNHHVYPVFDPKSVPQQDPNDPLPVYGTAVWGESYWAFARPAVFRFDVQVASEGPIREMAITVAPENRRVELISYTIEAAVGENRNMKPLSTALTPNKGS
jgi:hypothetical protein